MTNRQLAQALIGSIQEKLNPALDSIDADLESLRLVIGVAQNGPPQGQGDNTMSPSDWKTARDFHLAVAKAVGQIRGAQ